MSSCDSDAIDAEWKRQLLFTLKEFMKIVNILYLARLINPVPISDKPPLPIESNDFFSIIKHPCIQQKTAYDGTCSALTVITVKYSDVLMVLQHVLTYFSANLKQCPECWRLVILPLETYHILKDLFIHLSAADVDNKVVVMMASGEHLSNCGCMVAVKTLKTSGGEGHGNDTGSDVREVKVVS